MMRWSKRLTPYLLCVAVLAPGAVATAQDAGAPAPTAPVENAAGYLPYTEPLPLDRVSIWGALARSVMALGVVLGLFGGSVLVLRRYLPGVAGGGGYQPVRVLARIGLSPKQAVYFLHLPGRVLVVGSGGGQLTTLSEITDAEEVAQLVQASPTLAASAGTPFGGLLRRRLEDAHGAPAAAGAAGPEVSLDAIRRQIANLRALARTESS